MSHVSSFEDLEKVLKKNEVLKKFSIRRLGVFGSFARNNLLHLPTLLESLEKITLIRFSKLVNQ